MGKMRIAFPPGTRSPAPGRRDEGFSLPELMVVLAIIMLLVVLSLPRFRGAKEAAENAAAAQSMRAIHTSQEAYRITNGSYASSFAQLTSTRGGPLLEGEMQGGEDTLVYKGYIFHLRRSAPDQYTVTAEPVMNRDVRPWFEMNQLGFLKIVRGVPVEEGVGVPGGQ
jgi:prepilin-type N-terminal cleavage/methylation domain-containing protein